jgi:esterase/lipase superfamily enzyme
VESFLRIVVILAACFLQSCASYEAATGEFEGPVAVKPNATKTKITPKIAHAVPKSSPLIRPERTEKKSKKMTYALRPPRPLTTDLKPREPKEAAPETDVLGKQPVLFATNRKWNAKATTLSETFQMDRDSRVTYGHALVTIPKDHNIGEVERPRTTLLIFTEDENARKHFLMKEFGTLTREEFASRIGGQADSVLLFVHGYNVTFYDAIFKAAQIAFDANYQGTVIAFAWPSAANTLLYDYDNVSARYSPPALLEVLQLVRAQAPQKKLIIVAHSLGSDVVVETLQRARLSGIHLNISELVFAAPDVDKDLFMSKAEDIKEVAGNVTIYASSADKALLVSKRKASGSRMGYIEAGQPPNFVKGMETIDVTAVGDDMLALNHGTYSGSRSVLDDLGRIIASGTHPPHVRSPTLRSMPDREHTDYWMYPR